MGPKWNSPPPVETRPACLLPLTAWSFRQPHPEACVRSAASLPACPSTFSPSRVVVPAWAWAPRVRTAFGGRAWSVWAAADRQSGVLRNEATSSPARGSFAPAWCPPGVGAGGDLPAVARCAIRSWRAAWRACDALPCFRPLSGRWVLARFGGRGRRGGGARPGCLGRVGVNREQGGVCVGRARLRVTAWRQLRLRLSRTVHGELATVPVAPRPGLAALPDAPITGRIPPSPGHQPSPGARKGTA